MCQYNIFICLLIPFLFLFSIYWLNVRRYSVQEKILRHHNEEDRYSIRSTTKLNANEFYDPNQNKYYKVNGNIVAVKPSLTSSPMRNGTNGTGNIDSNGHGHHHHHHHNHIINNGNGIANNANNGNNNGNVVVAPSAIIRERYQHPALVAIINEAQGIKFRGKCSYIVSQTVDGLRFSRTQTTTQSSAVAVILVNRKWNLHIGVPSVYVMRRQQPICSQMNANGAEKPKKVRFNYHIKSYFNLFVSFDLHAEYLCIFVFLLTSSSSSFLFVFIFFFINLHFIFISFRFFIPCAYRSVILGYSANTTTTSIWQQ